MGINWKQIINLHFLIGDSVGVFTCYHQKIELFPL